MATLTKNQMLISQIQSLGQSNIASDETIFVEDYADLALLPSEQKTEDLIYYVRSTKKMYVFQSSDSSFQYVFQPLETLITQNTNNYNSLETKHDNEFDFLKDLIDSFYINVQTVSASNPKTTLTMNSTHITAEKDFHMSSGKKMVLNNNDVEGVKDLQLSILKSQNNIELLRVISDKLYLSKELDGNSQNVSNVATLDAEELRTLQFAGQDGTVYANTSNNRLTLTRDLDINGSNIKGANSLETQTIKDYTGVKDLLSFDTQKTRLLAELDAYNNKITNLNELHTAKLYSKGGIEVSQISDTKMTMVKDLDVGGYNLDSVNSCDVSDVYDYTGTNHILQMQSDKMVMLQNLDINNNSLLQVNQINGVTYRPIHTISMNLGGITSSQNVFNTSTLPTGWTNVLSVKITFQWDSAINAPHSFGTTRRDLVCEIANGRMSGWSCGDEIDGNDFTIWVTAGAGVAGSVNIMAVISVEM